VRSLSRNRLIASPFAAGRVGDGGDGGDGGRRASGRVNCTLFGGGIDFGRGFVSAFAWGGGRCVGACVGARGGDAGGDSGIKARDGERGDPADTNSSGLGGGGTWVTKMAAMEALGPGLSGGAAGVSFHLTGRSS
jgi:hypothetical protein